MRKPFAAAHESASGPKRKLVAETEPSAFRAEADMSSWDGHVCK